MPDQGERPAQGLRRAEPSGRQPLYAAVDLGTNNCRLLIAEPRQGGFRAVESHSQAVRLGEGIASEGRISDAAWARGMEALRVIRDKVRARGVPHVRCVATEACRVASNGRAFIDEVRNTLGLSFRVIDPEEEARLAVIGCHNLIAPDADTAIVVDIGGGSTEISVVDASRARRDGLRGMLRDMPLLGWESHGVGVVTLTERHAGRAEAERYDAMLEVVRVALRGSALAASLGDRPHGHLVGTSGTVTSLAALHLGLERYQRSEVDGAWMSREDAARVTRDLHAMGPEGRKAQGCIGQDRAHLIMAGCAILQAVFETYPVGRIRVADRGLREGLLLSMIHGPPRRSRGRGKGPRPIEPPRSSLNGKAGA
jgi:exopolyphosphatase/guanosine-5'-triphosphate,3'-diphosphate pyrophosphatase